MTMEELDNVGIDQGHFIVSIVNHKRSVDGSAKIVQNHEIYQLLLAYLSHIRPYTTKNPDTSMWSAVAHGGYRRWDYHRKCLRPSEIVKLEERGGEGKGYSFNIASGCPTSEDIEKCLLGIRGEELYKNYWTPLSSEDWKDFTT